MKISKYILRDIDKRKKIIDEDKNRWLNAVFNRRKRYLQTIAAFHSAALEHPEDSQLALRRKNTKAQRNLQRATEQVKKAWNLLIDAKEELLHPYTFGKVNYILLDEDSAPKPGEWNGYRTERVSLRLNYTPPNPLRVSDHMEDLLGRLNEALEKDTVHPVEIAVDAHFGIAAIQPYRDGNKRLARLVQGVILHQRGYPVPVIHTGEREIYLRHFDEAACATQGTGRIYIEEETNFGNYVASKVTNSLERVLGREY